jgi:hypothetical protein
MTEQYVQISSLSEAWSALATYCQIHERLYQRTIGIMQQTMTTIYALNEIDKHDIPAIHSRINDILKNVDSLFPLFKGYYNDDLQRVRLVDILQYIAIHEKGLETTIEGQGIEMSVLLAQLQGLVQLDEANWYSCS